MAILRFLLSLVRLPFDFFFLTFDFGRVLIWPVAVALRKILRLPTRAEDPLHRGGDVLRTGAHDCPRAWKYGSRGIFRQLCPFMRQTEAGEPACTFHVSDPHDTYWPSRRRRVALGACLLAIWGGIGGAGVIHLQQLPSVQRWLAQNQITDSGAQHPDADPLADLARGSRTRRPGPKVRVSQPTSRTARRGPQEGKSPSPGSATLGDTPATELPPAQRKAEAFVQSGDEYFAQGRYIEATIEYKNAVQKDRANARAWLQIGLSGVRMGRRDQEVRDAIEKALRLDPTAAEAYVALSKIALGRRDALQAVEHARKLKELRPTDPHALILLSSCLRAAGDPTAAVAEATAAIELPNATPDTFTAAAELYLLQGDFQKAEQAGRRAIELDADCTNARITLAAALRRQGKLDPAKEELDALLAQKVKDPRAALELAELLAARRDLPAAIALLEDVADRQPKFYLARARLAGLLVQSGQANKGMTVAKRLLNEYPEQVQAHLVLARMFLARGLHSITVDHCEKVLRVDRGNVQARVLLARAHMADQRYEDAVHQLATAHQAGARDLAVLVMLGNAYRAQDQLDLAKQWYETAAKTYPESPLPHMSLGALHVSRGLPEAAILCYEEALKLSPESILAANNLASLLLGHDLGADTPPRENVERAYRLARDVRKRRPAYVVAADTYGWACYKRGQHREAVEALSFAARRLPRVPAVRYHLAAALYETGDLAKAKQELEAAFALSQDFKGAAGAKALLASIGESGKPNDE